MSEPQEPCRRCGDETAAGSPRFSDRTTETAPNGSRAYLCQSCATEEARAATAKEPRVDAVAADLGWPRSGVTWESMQTDPLRRAEHRPEES